VYGPEHISNGTLLCLETGSFQFSTAKGGNSCDPVCPSVRLSVCHVVVNVNKRSSTIMWFLANGSPSKGL